MTVLTPRWARELSLTSDTVALVGGTMVIHLGAWAEASTSSCLAQFVDKRSGRDIYLGKRLIGWNLSDTIVLRSQGLTQANLQTYVKHFAAQRHVVFEHEFVPSKIDAYLRLARELRNYLFAFVDTPHLVRDDSRILLKQRILGAACNVVTLRPARTVQQLEALLLSAPLVLRSDEPLVLPQAAPRRTRAAARKAQEAA